jgi:hypothetical protein
VEVTGRGDVLDALGVRGCLIAIAILVLVPFVRLLTVVLGLLR